ncbi:hypothetical protein [Bacillus sp. FJAT-47783]|uniref:hypothetical protein n=1 Tax=Bacillus sp. FJAT-47783 TaxID=2922712 RepID=UPI001FAC37DC|nr:hypothetical protein [Bacillus sp. FJAT-47783]
MKQFLSNHLLNFLLVVVSITIIYSALQVPTTVPELIAFGFGIFGLLALVYLSVSMKHKSQKER